jgi:uncharacterized protein (DUF305 family)
MSPRFALVLTAALAAAPALAQTHSGHAGHAMPGAESAATAGFRAANARMHKDMDISYSGDADADFVRGMIPHHQGAIDMAKVVLANGKDPQVRRMAQEIIAAQEKEIAEMRAMLKARGIAAP